MVARWQHFFFFFFFLRMRISGNHKCIISVTFLSKCRPILIPGGGLLSPKSYVDVPAGPRKSDYPYTNFLPNFPHHHYTIFERKALNLTKLGAFYNNLPQIHPIYVIWAPSSSDENPLIAIPNFAKRCPKRQAHIRIPCQCENPPPRTYIRF